MIINLDNTCHNIGLNRIAAMGLKAKKSYFSCKIQILILINGTFLHLWCDLPRV